MLHKDLSEKAIKAFYTVYNTLGFGFLENVYENALLIELNKMGLKTDQQKSIKVKYKGLVVGDYFADIVINDLIIIEIKAAEGIRKEHKKQILNYLRATDKEVGLLLNFGKRPEFKRAILTNDMKNKPNRNYYEPDFLILSDKESS